MVVERIHSHRNQHHDQPHLQYFKCVCFTVCRRFDVMGRFFRTCFTGLSRRYIAVVLAFVWCSGLVLGSAAAYYADTSFLSMMRTAVSGRVSISGLFAVFLFPLLFSAFAVYISCYWLFVPIAFLKAFSFSFFGCCLARSFGIAGFMVRMLVMFSDCLLMPVLLWLWFSSCCRQKRSVILRHCIAVLFLICIGFIDLNFISPFLANLLL